MIRLWQWISVLVLVAVSAAAIAEDNKNPSDESKKSKPTDESTSVVADKDKEKVHDKKSDEKPKKKRSNKDKSAKAKSDDKKKSDDDVKKNSNDVKASDSDKSKPDDDTKAVVGDDDKKSPEKNADVVIKPADGEAKKSATTSTPDKPKASIPLVPIQDPLELKIDSTLPLQPKKELPKPITAAPAKPESPVPAAAKPAPTKTSVAVTDESQADADYQLQGEYMTVAAPQHPIRWGLQVVSLGGGQFDAVLYRGGLPGAGWDRNAKYKLKGKSEQEALTLRDERITAVIGSHGSTLTANDSPVVLQMEKYFRISPTLGAVAPANAVVLFDGKSADAFTGASINEDGTLGVGGLTKMTVQDFFMHVEFRTPYMPYATGQARGNSGIYIQQRYEVQVLDSFGLDGVENECGGLYRQHAPDLNMAYPPLRWQTYDIWFTAVRWDADGKKIAPARITVMHNGVPVHLNYEITGKTGAGKAESPDAMPILLQNHSNPVAFRNIWLIPSVDAPGVKVVGQETAPEFDYLSVPTNQFPTIRRWHHSRR